MQGIPEAKQETDELAINFSKNQLKQTDSCIDSMDCVECHKLHMQNVYLLYNY